MLNFLSPFHLLAIKFDCQNKVANFESVLVWNLLEQLDKMYETDILIFIILVLVSIYLRDFLIEMFKYFEVFVKVQGPKTVPISIMAFIFTLRSETGEMQSSVPKGSRNFLDFCVFFFVIQHQQIASKYFKTCRRNIETFILSGSVWNTSSSPMTPALCRSSSHILNASRRTSSWNFLDFPMD